MFLMIVSYESRFFFEGHDSMSTGHPGYVRTLNTSSVKGH